MGSQYRGKWHYVSSYAPSDRYAKTICGRPNVRRLLIANRGTDSPKKATCKLCLRNAQYRRFMHDRFTLL